MVVSAEVRLLDAATKEEARYGEALERVEGWLLHSGIQVDEGDQRGGIAGWLDQNGRPDFVYLEIAGYYLTAMAWLSSCGASSPEHVDTARQRGRLAATWIAGLVSRHRVPPTRLYLSDDRA